MSARRLATRAYALAVLVAGWTATVVSWPDRTPAAAESVTLIGCGLAVGWLLRHGVGMSVQGAFATLEELVLVPLVFVYPAGWVMAMSVAATMCIFVGTKSFRTKWYRAVFASGWIPLLAAASSQAAAVIPGRDPLRLILAGFAAALTWALLSDLGTTIAVVLERGSPGRLYSINDTVATLRPVPAVAMLSVLVYQAREGDWPVLVAAGLVLLVVRQLNRAVQVDIMAVEHEAERKELLRLVIGGGDRTRREVTSHIHDGPLQVVVATRVLLDSMISRLQAGAAPDIVQLGALSGHLAGAIDDLRSVLHEGYRDRLLVAGLRDGLIDILDAHASAFPGGYELAVDDDLDLSVDTSVLLLLILREAVVNAAKHSQARIVVVTVRGEGATVVSEVQDDGVGIDTALLSVRRQQGHLGVALMHERVERAGGTATIERRESGGTTVRVTLPLAVPQGQPPKESWERPPRDQPGS